MEKNFNLKRTEAPPNTFDPIDELPEEEKKNDEEESSKNQSGGTKAVTINI